MEYGQYIDYDGQSPNLINCESTVALKFKALSHFCMIIREVLPTFSYINILWEPPVIIPCLLCLKYLII